MITVAKRGIPPEEKLVAFTCRTCKSEFEGPAADFKEVIDWREGNFYQTKCPVCGASCTKAVP